MEKTNFEDWFLFKDEALVRLKEVVREIHWWSSRGMEKYHYMLPFKHVRYEAAPNKLANSHRTEWSANASRRFWFNFEMERGRLRCGPCYMLEAAHDYSFMSLSVCGNSQAAVVIDCTIEELTGEMLLETIRLYVVQEVLTG